MRTILLEKVDTGQTIEALMNQRLRLSYQEHPTLPKARKQAQSA